MAQGVKGSTPICKVEDCDRISVARGYCQKHYDRYMAHGSPYYVKKHHDLSPEGRKRISDGLKAYWASHPEFREAKREHMRKLGKAGAKNKEKAKEISLKHLKKANKKLYQKQNKIVNDRDFFTSFIKRYCPDIDTDDDIPVTVYRELIGFFHPELLPTLEREWKLFVED